MTLYNTLSLSSTRLFALVCLLLSPAIASATSMIPLNFDQITDRATLIIHGTVTAQEVVYDEPSKHVVTITHFDVIDTLKGHTGQTHSIKQLGGQLPGDTIVHRIQGIPKFVNGQDYVVFLPAVSTLGFSTPIGFAQGNYHVRQVDGEAVVRDRRATSTRSKLNTPASRIGSKPAGVITLQQLKADVAQRVNR